MIICLWSIISQAMLQQPTHMSKIIDGFKTVIYISEVILIYVWAYYKVLQAL